VTKLRLSDLPPKVRAQVKASDPKLYEEAVEAKPASSRKRTPRVDVPGVCHTCNERFPTPDVWQRHVDSVHGGARWDIDFESNWFTW
jgi:hypothetical protein